MMSGFYLWPRCDLGLGDRGRALAGRLRDLVEPVIQVPRCLSDARYAVATSAALLRELLKRR